MVVPNGARDGDPFGTNPFVALRVGTAGQAAGATLTNRDAIEVGEVPATASHRETWWSDEVSLKMHRGVLKWMLDPQLAERLAAAQSTARDRDPEFARKIGEILSGMAPVHAAWREAAGERAEQSSS